MRSKHGSSIGLDIIRRSISDSTPPRLVACYEVRLLLHQSYLVDGDRNLR